MEDVVDDLSETEARLSRRLRGEVNKLEARDVARRCRRPLLAKAINADKANLLRGQPIQIVETRDAASLIRKLEAAGIVDVAGPGVERRVVTDELLPGEAA